MNSQLVKQSYSQWQRLRAFFYARFPVLVEAFIALGLLLLVVTANFLYYSFALHEMDPLKALAGALSLVVLQFQNIEHFDQTGAALIVFNVIFTVFFAQSLLNAIRGLVRPYETHVRQRALASTLNNHLIVCGLGRVGLRVAQRLVASGSQVVIIEQEWDSEYIPDALDLKIPVILGDASRLKTLEEAGMKRARAVIACIDGDLINLEIALLVRSVRQDLRVIVRSFRDDFDRSLERRFGPQTAFSASALAAPTFGLATVVRNLEYVIPFGKEYLGVIQIAAPRSRAFQDQIREYEKQQQIRILRTQVVRGEQQYVLAGTIPTLAAINVALGTPEPALPAIKATPWNNNDKVIVCGLGKIGYRMVRLLHSLAPGLQIVVITRPDASRTFEKQIDRLERVRIVHGDARDADLLTEIGIQDALAVAAVTSDDLTNLQIGLEARHLRADIHLVLRVFSENLANQLVDLFGIHTTYSVSNLASPTLAASAGLSGVQGAFALKDDVFVVKTMAVSKGDSLTGRTYGWLLKQYGIIGIANGSGQIFPLVDQSLQVGEQITLMGTLSSFGRLMR